VYNALIYWNKTRAGFNKYLYNGKELQDDNLGGVTLNWYDYGGRYYDPQIARWTTIDPLSEYHFKYSPYNYCFNNPIRYTDPFGLDVKAINGGYQITGTDIYTYFGYLQTIASGQGSMDNLVQGLSQASQQNQGSGGPMDASIGDVTVNGQAPGAPGWFRSTGSEQVGGWYMTSELGQGTPDRAKHVEDKGNIDDLLYLNEGVTSLAKLPEYMELPEKLNEIVELVVELTPDNKITEETTGTGEKTDAHGQPLPPGARTTEGLPEGFPITTRKGDVPLVRGDTLIDDTKPSDSGPGKDYQYWTIQNSNRN